MKLYYRETSGGAQYYCLKPIEQQPDGTVEGTEIGDLRTAVLRTDGGEIEVLTKSLVANNIKLIIN